MTGAISIPSNNQHTTQNVQSRASLKEFATSYSRSMMFIPDLLDQQQTATTSPTTAITGGAGEYTSISQIIQEDTNSDPHLEPEISPDDGEVYVVRSTFAQSVFNAINVLMGVGLLSLPFAFRLTGWILGIGLLIGFAGITRYTATLLAKCLDYPHPTYSASLSEEGEAPVIRKANTYADMGESAFGPNGRLFISIAFLMELFAASVALLILMADSVVALIPALNQTAVKISVAMLVLPSTWLKSLSVLAYGSIFGIIALVNLMGIIVFDGCTTFSSPGSLIVPAQTDLWPPSDIGKIPLAIGLIMAGFAFSHKFIETWEIPSNIHPWFETKNLLTSIQLNVTYISTIFFYLLVSSAGYLMFGHDLQQEITQNLASVSSYNNILTKVTIGLVAINPATKFALTMNPIRVYFQQGLYKSYPTLHESTMVIRVLLGTSITMLVLLTSLAFPEFHSVMSLLGSLFAGIVSVIFPVLCHVKLHRLSIGRFELVICLFLILIGSLVAIAGTIASLC